jgi:YD repeat-containing protein
MVYDGFGRQYQRTETMTGTTRTVTTLYYTTKPYIGLVQSETDSESGVVVSYTYDNYGKMLTRTETIDGADYTFTYAYDAYGRVTYITYPDGLQVKQTWTGNYLKSIVDVTTM